MTRQTDTDWIVEGAEVAEYNSRGYSGGTVRLTTIARLTATQIVLANGNRYNRERRRPVGDSSYGKELLPAGDERVLETLSRDQFTEMSRTVEDILRAVRNGKKARLDALNEIETAVAEARAVIEANAARVAEGK